MLTSDIFSERVTSAANLLVETHWLHLNDEMIDNIIVLRMSKRFMERVRAKKDFLQQRLEMSCLMKVQMFSLLSLIFCYHNFYLLLFFQVCMQITKCD